MQKGHTADSIATELRLAIFRGTLRPGVALRQEYLAKRFAVSRIPVRDALRSLERDGLVEVLPNRRAFVVQLTVPKLKELTDLRVLIEGDLIRRAVPALTPADLEAIRGAVSAARRESDSQSWAKADLALHEALYKPAQRPTQLALFQSLRLAVQQYEALYGGRRKQRKSLLDDHDTILEACSKGDAELAHNALVEHLRRAGTFLAECIKSAAPHFDQEIL